MSPVDVRHKIRLRFRKDGDLRFVSHHDLMRCLERTLRRANIPFRSTSGFHPQPRMVFALSLSLGVIGACEVLELELNEELAPEEVLARLGWQAPPGMTFLSARIVPFNKTAQVRRVVYRLDLPPDRLPDFRQRAAELLQNDACLVIRRKPAPRQINIRPYIREIRLDDQGIELDLWVTPNGTARADELITLLGGRDLLAAGAVLTRSLLEVTDEVDPEILAQGPDPERFKGLSVPLERIPADAIENDDDEPTPTASWGLSPNGPVVE